MKGGIILHLNQLYREIQNGEAETLSGICRTCIEEMKERMTPEEYRQAIMVLISDAYILANTALLLNSSSESMVVKGSLFNGDQSKIADAVPVNTYMFLVKEDNPISEEIKKKLMESGVDVFEMTTGQTKDFVAGPKDTVH